MAVSLVGVPVAVIGRRGWLRTVVAGSAISGTTRRVSDTRATSSDDKPVLGTAEPIHDTFSPKSVRGPGESVFSVSGRSAAVSGSPCAGGL